jgi:2-polyprenyl-6-hydroxyphenyl methylase/3-demethylubiquinone-9 3-methyltransferase
MAARGAVVTGLDLATASLNVAKLHLHESGLNVVYQCIAVETLAQQQPASFDGVCCMEMLEHVPDPASVVQACFDLVKPNGLVFFSTLNKNPKAYCLAIVGAEYLLGLLPKGTHDYQKFITPAQLARWARQAGFELQAMKGMGYNPFTQKYRLNSDVSVNYLLQVKRPRCRVSS